MSTVRRPYWRYYVPDPYEHPEEIGDTMNLQVLAVINDTYISGHFEIDGDKILQTIFIPDFLTKNIISSDEIDAWTFTRELP